jgi:hypothetical protein
MVFVLGSLNLSISSLFLPLFLIQLFILLTSTCYLPTMTQVIATIQKRTLSWGNVSPNRIGKNFCTNYDISQTCKLRVLCFFTTWIHYHSQEFHFWEILKLVCLFVFDIKVDSYVIIPSELEKKCC